jgi:YD repeat-containing protein
MRPQPAITLLFALALLFLAVSAASAQYYYRDVLSAVQSRTQQQLYKASNVRKVTVHSNDPDGTENKDFFCEQSLNAEGTEMETLTGSPATGKSQLTTYFDKDAHVIRSIDSSDASVTITQYTYDASGNLLSINIDAHTDSGRYRTQEAHVWQYSADGKPTGLLRIKNGDDTTFVLLQTDSLGNVTDEASVRNGELVEHYYYYYDDDHHLTDIVRYNEQVQRMVPDYMFAYDDQGNLGQMIVVRAIHNDYRIWRYLYNPNKLKFKELCYDRDHRLIGSIAYTYAP